MSIPALSINYLVDLATNESGLLDNQSAFGHDGARCALVISGRSTNIEFRVDSFVQRQADRVVLFDWCIEKAFHCPVLANTFFNSSI